MNPRWRRATLTKWLWKLVILLEGVELESSILQFDTHNHSNLHARIAGLAAAGSSRHRQKIAAIPASRAVPPTVAARTRIVSAVPEFGWITGNLSDLSKRYFATTFLSSSPTCLASQSGLQRYFREGLRNPRELGPFPLSGSVSMCRMG